MIPRIAEKKLGELASMFKSVAVVGPRQSGKTTLVRRVFSDKSYVSLEDPDSREFAQQDPRGFLSEFPDGAVFDEAQRVPHLFSYLQGILDESPAKGQFILTGSNNFLMQENISQSLAGRVAYLDLLPFSFREIYPGNTIPSLEQVILKGFYPPVHDLQMDGTEWAKNYIKTYIERDVRQIKNIMDLLLFERFMKLLAGRNAQELNYSALSVEAGVDVKTVQSWIGVLESSYIIHLLRPHYKNYNKSIVKRPKLYFYDTAIVCSLLGIKQRDHLTSHPLRGAIFESLIVSELIKQRTHSGNEINLYYWRDKSGYEVDIVIDENVRLLPVEIKSGKTVHNLFFKNLDYWMKLSGEKQGVVIYGGDGSQKRTSGVHVISWKNTGEIATASQT